MNKKDFSLSTLVRETTPVLEFSASLVVLFPSDREEEVRWALSGSRCGWQRSCLHRPLAPASGLGCSAWPGAGLTEGCFVSSYHLEIQSFPKDCRPALAGSPKKGQKDNTRRRHMWLPFLLGRPPAAAWGRVADTGARALDLALQPGNLGEEWLGRVRPTSRAGMLGGTSRAVFTKAHHIWQVAVG